LAYFVNSLAHSSCAAGRTKDNLPVGSQSAERRFEPEPLWNRFRVKSKDPESVSIIIILCYYIPGYVCRRDKTFHIQSVSILIVSPHATTSTLYRIYHAFLWYIVLLLHHVYAYYAGERIFHFPMIIMLSSSRCCCCGNKWPKYKFSRKIPPQTEMSNAAITIEYGDWRDYENRINCRYVYCILSEPCWIIT